VSCRNLSFYRKRHGLLLHLGEELRDFAGDKIQEVSKVVAFAVPPRAPNRSQPRKAPAGRHRRAFFLDGLMAGNCAPSADEAAVRRATVTSAAAKSSLDCRSCPISPMQIYGLLRNGVRADCEPDSDMILRRNRITRRCDPVSDTFLLRNRITRRCDLVSDKIRFRNRITTHRSCAPIGVPMAARLAERRACTRATTSWCI
jgi:hypothetical protein